MRETSDDYPKVVFHINARWRVIECRDSVQWILQKRTNKAGEGKWYGKSYCRTKTALIRCVQGKIGVIDPVSETFLHRLPDRIKENVQL